MNRFTAIKLLALLTVVSALFAAGSASAAEGGPGGGGMHQRPLEAPSGIQGGPGGMRPSRPAPQFPGSQPPGSRTPHDERPDSGSTSITFRGNSYLVSGGQWYQRRGAELVAVEPPAGVLVRDLPKGYSMRWIAGAPYFYADGLYYVWRERLRRYEIMQGAPTEEAGPPRGHAAAP